MMNAEQPQIVGASALQEMQIAGVIDPAGKIRVLEIDALAKLVTAVREPAGDRDRGPASLKASRREG